MFYDVSAIADALEERGYDRLKRFLGNLSENGVLNFTRWLSTQMHSDDFSDGLTDELLTQIKTVLISNSDFIRAVNWDGKQNSSGCTEVTHSLEQRNKLFIIKQIFSANIFNVLAAVYVIICFAYLFTVTIINPTFAMTDQICDTMIKILFAILGFYCGKVTVPDGKK